MEGQKLSTPIFTPSTKAEQGSHDENISPAQGSPPLTFLWLVDKLFLTAAKVVGQELYDQISTAALKLYSTAAEFALTRGLILADTKFEFGLIPDGPEKRLILIDELLTPDSSRYWPLDGYKAGGSQPSFDKQYLRDWLVSVGFHKGLESGPPGQEGKGWTIESNIVKGTRERYVEAVELLTS